MSGFYVVEKDRSAGSHTICCVWGVCTLICCVWGVCTLICYSALSHIKASASGTDLCRHWAATFVLRFQMHSNHPCATLLQDNTRQWTLITFWIKLKLTVAVKDLHNFSAQDNTLYDYLRSLWWLCSPNCVPSTSLVQADARYTVVWSQLRLLWYTRAIWEIKATGGGIWHKSCSEKGKFDSKVNCPWRIQNEWQGRLGGGHLSWRWIIVEPGLLQTSVVVIAGHWPLPSMPLHGL